MYMRTNTTKMVVGVGVVCVLVATGAWIIRERSNNNSLARANLQSIPAPSIQNTPTPTEALQPSPTPTRTRKPMPTPTPKLAYDAAVRQFEGRRIQFNAECSAIPSQATYKSGTSLMLDNRAGHAQTVLFNLQRYTIQAYDYVIVSAVADYTPAVTYIDCGQKQNVAKITIQK